MPLARSVKIVAECGGSLFSDTRHYVEGEIGGGGGSRVHLARTHSESCLDNFASYVPDFESV